MERFSPTETPFGFSSYSATVSMPTFLDAILADMERNRAIERRSWETLIREARQALGLRADKSST